MKYTHNAFLRAEEELKKRRQDAEDDLAAREDYIYSKLPEVRDMRESLKTSYLELMKIIAGHDPDAAASAAAVREKNLATQERIAILIEDLTGDRKYLEPHYTCSKCSDTGYFEGERCDCMKDLLRAYTVQELNDNMSISLHDFSEFDPSFYVNESDRERMAKWIAYLKNYCETFPKDTRSMLFSGGTGLGKTFVSSCVAKALSERGFVTVFGSAYDLLRKVEDEHFGREEGDTLDSLISADMLIIDDLGSEPPSQFYESTLYNILNGRINRRRPLIISTNLSQTELEKRYHDRISSRVVGFAPLRFSGRDIRQQIAQRRFKHKK